jgi:hypothetical protein
MLRIALHSSVTTNFLSGIKWNEDEFGVRGHGRLLLVRTLRVRKRNALLEIGNSQCAVHSHKDTMISLAPQDLFLKRGFIMGCAKIWLTSHTKQETKQDGVTLTSFPKVPGSNLNRGTNYPH